MQLKTFKDKNLAPENIDPKDIDCILRGRITGVLGTLVRLKNGEEKFLAHSEKEVSDEMNKARNPR
jgi:hypothetical protein